MDFHVKTETIKKRKFSNMLYHPVIPRALLIVCGSSWAFVIWDTLHFLNNNYLYCVYGGM